MALIPLLRIKSTHKLSAILFLALLTYLYFTASHTSKTSTTPWTPIRPQSSIRIATATIFYSTSTPPSLTLHNHYAQTHGYKLHVLRTPLVRGFANPLLWLHSLIVAELQKPVEAQTEWILYFETPTVLISHPNIPLHTFLPPTSHSDTFKALGVIGTKANGADIDTGAFLIRVSSLSLRILTLAMAGVYLDPERDWGKDIAGAALQDVLGRDRYRDKVVWLPGAWWNGTGAVFVKPGVRRVMEVEKMLGEMRKEISREVFPGPEEVREYWDAIVEARRVLGEARERGHTHWEGEFVEEVGNVKYWVEERTWDTEGLKRCVGVLKGKMGIGEVVGFEAVH